MANLDGSRSHGGKWDILAGAMLRDEPAHFTHINRTLLAAARVGQHVFAVSVLSNCGQRCVFCGLNPWRSGAKRMLVQGDLRRPAELLAEPEIRAHLDFGRPAAIGLFAILHFLTDAYDPAGAVACLRDAVAPGSYLAVSYIGTDFFPDKSALAEAVAVYERASERVWPRSRDQILSFLRRFRAARAGPGAQAPMASGHRQGRRRHAEHPVGRGRRKP